MPELLLTNANAPSVLHSATPLCSVLFAIRGGFHLGHRYGVPSTGSVDGDVGAVSPTACGRMW